MSFLEANGLVVAAIAVVALFALVLLRAELIGDTWMMLVSGREVAEHGLPHHDTLFLWTNGRPWVDQQWLAQLAYYGLHVAGGVRLLLIANTFFVVGAAAIAFTFARLRGASPRATFLIAVLLPLMAPWALQVRTQAPAQLLFAATFGLLTLRSPLTWTRVALVLALLVVWANVHGTVVLGAALAMLCALFAVRATPGSRRPALALLCLSPLCVFASPYGFALADYYRELLTNPLLPKFVAEWKLSTPGVLTAVFYAVLLGGLWLLVRHGRKVAAYDKVALALLAISAVMALRSIIWFGIAAVIVLTPLVDDALGAARSLTGKMPARAGLVVGVMALVVGAIAFSSSSTSLAQYWPRAAADRLALLTSQHGTARVFADGTYADWLLWLRPELRNRIAYDARFELLRRGEFTRLSDYGKKKGEHWGQAATGYNVFVYDTGAGHCPGTCVMVYRDRYVTVATRSRS
ncbi:MAG: hypothetical protein M3R37_01860 [Actinomycetota bacterium]|nr:hypothetical protein [Actinomycetota bacterium]